MDNRNNPKVVDAVKPILYASTETQFNTNGIGVLAGAVSCKVTEELNGEYELVMQYPIDGIHYSDIKSRSLIMAKPNREDNPQPFRVYRITKPISGIVTVYAEHISYDLTGIPVRPFTAGSAAGAITALETGAAVASPFAFWTDKTNAGNLTVATPLSSRFVLGGGDNSILGVYGGELEFDRYTVRLHGARGINRGTSIRYGKNLTSLEQDENISNTYTGVYPYYADTEGNVTQLSDPIVPAPGTYDYVRILPLDLSMEFDEAPTQAALREAAEAYIQNNNIGIPAVSLKVSFAQLAQTKEYEHLELLERVTLGDTVNVEFAALGVSATAKCIKTIYNVLTDQYDSIELGDARPNIADTIAGQQEAINAVINQKAGGEVSTAVQEAINAATALITGNKGGYVVLHSTTGGKQPDEILILDKPSIEEAVKVWRWNNSGLGYSSTGYNGPYETAITQDGQIVADFITAGGMNAARITAGILSSADGRVQFDLTAGTLYVKSADNTVKLGFDTAGNLTVRGTIYATAGEFAGTLKSVSGSFTNLTSTGSISFRNGAMEIGYFQGDTWINFGDTAAISGGSGYIDMVANRGVSVSECDFTANENMEVGGNLTIYGSTLNMPNIRTGTYDANLRWDTDYGYFYRKTSSRRYKHDIDDIRNWEKIYELRPVNYVGNEDTNERIQMGFIAEEVYEAMPELTELRKNDEGIYIPEGVFYAHMTAPIVRALQDINQRLKKLEGEN